MANNDLMKWTTSEVDFYELLGITLETCSESELQRAYRKTSLKYHPDKLGKNFDADKYELFQAAHEVLKDPELKAKYDNHRNAKLLKQRANELFEGKRRQMKEDLEARERGDINNGTKRPRDDHQAVLNKFAEEGRQKRAKREAMMATSSPVPAPQERAPVPAPSSPKKQKVNVATQGVEEDEVERLERRIREAEVAKAKRKAEKKARKSGVFLPEDSPAVGSAARPKSHLADQDTTTPIKRPDIFKALKADEKSSASPKFSFSPNTTPKTNDFAATMARLKAAERQRLEDEIRQQEAGEIVE